ncbi:YdcF family protein [Anabaena sp. CCY 0017]|uniref:YdcF family protein n=1 Tax=Anabaena sp. CCY 0017 TaxID=3103866 RepID=UPI0039C5C451
MLKLNKKYGVLILAGLILALFSTIPIRLAIASYQSPHPQAILTLGGDPEREEFTAEFAQKHPRLDIWVSSGSPPQQALDIFASADIAKDRFHLDYRAVDTVTNFTSLVDDLKNHQIQHIYLITSGFHMPRARAIATLVLGSQGITFTPISIPSSKPRESIVRIVRDSGRSLLWIVSGRTGASFHPRFREPFYAAR